MKNVDKIQRDSLGRFIEGNSFSSEILKKMSAAKQGMVDEKNNSWKGESVSYERLHSWIEKVKGTPKKCEECRVTKSKGKIRRIQWANVSGQYKRNVEDWIALCIPCHRKLFSSIKGINKKLKYQVQWQRKNKIVQV